MNTTSTHVNAATAPIDALPIDSLPCCSNMSGYAAYYSISGTMTGRVRWNPLVYCHPDKHWFTAYLFQLCLREYTSSNPDCVRFQRGDFVRLNAYVPPALDDTVYSALRENAQVTIHYVVRTNLYPNSNAQNATARKTILSVKQIYFHDTGLTISLPEEQWTNHRAKPRSKSRSHTRAISN